jgi:hypothetical protein
MPKGYRSLLSWCPDDDPIDQHALFRSEAALAEKGIPETDRQMRRDFVNRFHHMLHHMQRRGHAVRIGKGEGVRWKLAPREPDLL